MTDTAFTPKSFRKEKRFPRLRAFFARLFDRVRAFSLNEKNTLKICFLLPFLLLFLSHAFFGVFPFGWMSVLTLDLNGQYVFFFNALRDVVYGEGSLLYSFVRGMGGEFMGIYAYYLASPLSYIVCLLPKSMMPEALYLILCLKAGLCGLTFGALIKKVLHTGHFATVLVSLCYALSGYVTSQQSNTMWIDAVYLLPLIFLGMHGLIQGRRVWLYTLALTGTLLFNYYIGYMTCIFLLFAFFAFYFGMQRKTRNPDGIRLHFLKTLSRMAFYSAVAILMAAVILLPAYYSLTFGKDSFTNPEFTWDKLYSHFVYFSKFLFPSFDTFKPDGAPQVYCGIFSLLLFPLFFLSPAVRFREKLMGGALFFSFLAFSNIKTIDLIFHGGQAPNWMNCRYSFCLIFTMLFCVAILLSRRPRLPAVLPLVTGGALFLVTLSLLHFLREDLLPHLIPILASLPLIAAYSIFFFFYLRKKERLHRIGRLVIPILVIAEIFLQSLLTLILIHNDVVIVRRSRYTSMDDRFLDIVDYVKEHDDDPFFRTEKTVIRKLNDSYQLGYYGLSGSTSTLNKSQIDFLRLLGYTGDSIYTQYCFPNAASDSLLGVKYVLTEPDEVVSTFYQPIYAKVDGEILTLTEGAYIEPDGKEYALIDNGTRHSLKNARDVIVYKNTLALSLGYAVHEQTSGITFTMPEIDDDGNDILPDGVTYYSSYEGTYKTAFERLNLLYTTLSGEGGAIFTPIDFSKEIDGVKSGTSYRTFKKTSPNGQTEKKEYFQSHYYEPKVEGEKGKVRFTFEGVAGEHIYMHIPVATNKETSFTINGKPAGNYFGIFTYGLLDLGEFAEGESVTVEFTVSDKLYMGRNVSYFYTMSEENLEKAITALQATELHVTRFDDDSFTATIDAGEKERLIMTTIPYDKGWRVTLDGEEIETEALLDACLGIRVPAGTHTLEFRYFPDCYTIAILLSASGVILFVYALAVRAWVRKDPREKTQKTKSRKEKTVCSTTSAEN